MSSTNRVRQRLGRWLLGLTALVSIVIIACGGADAPAAAPTAMPGELARPR